MGNDSDAAKAWERKPHTKSRGGCLGCKKRHIRCDEQKPQCKKCTKQSFTCEYPTIKIRNESSQRPLFPATDQNQSSNQEQTLWDDPGSQVGLVILAPKSSALFPQPSPKFNLSTTDLKLLDHWKLVMRTFWSDGIMFMLPGLRQLPAFFSLWTSSDVVRNSVLALSASHLLWLTRLPKWEIIAMAYQTTAYHYLQNEIQTFPSQNLDPVIAASFILTWQAPDWQSWCHLSRGNRAVVKASRPLIHNSAFADDISNHLKLLEIYEPLGIYSSPYKADRIERLRLGAWLKCVKEGLEFCTTRKSQQQLAMDDALLALLEGLRDSPPELTEADQYQLLFPLRGWLLSMSSSALDCEKEDLNALVSFVWYHVTFLVVKPFFPALGSMFFRAYLADPVQDISRYLAHMQSLDAAKSDGEIDAQLVKAIHLVEKALEVVLNE